MSNATNSLICLGDDSFDEGIGSATAAAFFAASRLRCRQRRWRSRAANLFRSKRSLAVKFAGAMVSSSTRCGMQQRLLERILSLEFCACKSQKSNRDKRCPSGPAKM